jgi:hypothetical protein
MTSLTSIPRPREDRRRRDNVVRKLVGALVSLCATLGLIALGYALGPLVPLGIAGFAIVALLPQAAKLVLPTLCAALLAAVALVGFNVALDFLVRLVAPDRRLPIAVGLVLALAVFGGVAYLVVHGSWSQVRVKRQETGRRPAFEALQPIQWTRTRSLVVAAVLSLLVIVALPPILGMRERNAHAVAAPQQVKAQLDVLIIAGSPQPGADRGAGGTSDVTPYTDAAGFDVRYTIGFASGERVRWGLKSSANEAAARAALDAREPAIAAPPVLRPEADRVVVLLVDGTAATVKDPAALPDVGGRAGEVTRWRRIARATAPAGTPVYALLETTKRSRLKRWTPFLTPGGAISLQALGSETVTDAAVRLGLAAPTAREDFTLAMRYRPVLLFDRDEDVPRPLSIEDLFANGKVRECEDRKLVRTDCTTVREPRELRNGGTHLQLGVPGSAALKQLARQDLRALAPTARTGRTSAEVLPPSAPGAPPPGTPSAGLPRDGIGAGSAPTPPPGTGTAIYVHPVPAVRDGRSLLYLDYWWYLPDNPARAGMGAFCGAGLVIPGVSCFDHQSDWEGVTVVIDRSRREPRPLAVYYAQHETVVGYRWSDLRRAWRSAEDRAPQGRAEADDADRPLVYLARGTHAAYPTRCRSDHCRQVAHDRGENRYDGGLPWIGNDTGACTRVGCLRMLPTATGGRAPALWNAFTGPWGRRHCLLTYYCDSGSAPAAPGQQDRYQHPTDPDCAGRPGGPGCKREDLID